MIETVYRSRREIARRPPPWSLGALVLLGLACGRDGGNAPTEMADERDPGSIQRVLPARTVVSDTVAIEGVGLGELPGLALFTGGDGAPLQATIVGWTDSLVHVLVPLGAGDGPVRIRTGDVQSNEIHFSVAPRLVSYANDLLPQVFDNVRTGCTSCHGGQNNLFLGSAGALMAGTSDHGPVVIPRNSASSVLLRKVLPDPPFGSRMPLGCAGNCLDDSQVRAIADWIDQGARNN